MQAAVAKEHLSFLMRRGSMILADRPAVFRYTIPFIAVAVAAFFAALLPGRLDPSHFTLFFLAVMLSAWYGGLGPGLVSTVLSVFALDYFFVAPLHALELDWHAFVRTGVFLVVAMITTVLTNARRRAEAALRQAQVELEDRVRERTAELAKTNDTLRHEIDERQKIERELLRVQQQMGRVERLATLGRMSATVAHDLGTPLNSVLGYTQLLAQEDLPERARRRLTIIETQIHRMGEIIQSYLSFSRGAPERARLNLNDLVRDTLLLLEPLFKQHGVMVNLHLAENLSVIYADSSSIQRMLINLLDNAVDACANGGRVTISTADHTSPNNREMGVVIALADTGAGIAPELLPNVFDLFVTTKNPGQGTGLGLIICQEIVKAHGGTINLASQPGEGTTVTVFLPVNSIANPALVTEERNERSNIDC